MKENRPFVVADAVAHIRDSAITLKYLNLNIIAEGPSNANEDLFAARRIADLVLVEEIRNLNEIMKDLSEEFEDVEFEPVKILDYEQMAENYKKELNDMQE